MDRKKVLLGLGAGLGAYLLVKKYTEAAPAPVPVVPMPPAPPEIPEVPPSPPEVPLPEIPSSIYSGMPPPGGWEWIREITDLEIRAAQRRAASTGETILEALLALYGRPVTITGVGRILSVEQIGDVLLITDRPFFHREERHTAFNVTWECYEQWNGWWGFQKLGYITATGIQNTVSLANWNTNPPFYPAGFSAWKPDTLVPFPDYPNVPLLPGVYTTRLFRDLSFLYGQETCIVITLQRGCGGRTVPAVRELVDTWTGMMILEERPVGETVIFYD